MMQRFAGLAACLIVLLSAAPSAALADEPRDTDRDILVTFVNDASASRNGFGPPYRNRRRYRIDAEARQQASEVAAEYALVEVDSWPIRSLSVYCVVYRVRTAEERGDVLQRLSADSRVESAQAVHEFETRTDPAGAYDDTFANLQHGIATLSVSAAHRYSAGRGVRVAIVDSNVDDRHEDLKGRFERVRSYSVDGAPEETGHGTAVASVIGALSNNAKGIVGVAPRAELDVYAACWATAQAGRTVCDSFSLAKALDTLVARSAHVVNLSLTGPHDALLERLLRELFDQGAILVAARTAAPRDDSDFPASMPEVIAVSASTYGSARVSLSDEAVADTQEVFAPGQHILVAVPDDQYDFRSGSSIAAAHVTGIVALMLADDPDLSTDEVRHRLRRSQVADSDGIVSVNACISLKMADAARDCS